MNYLEFFTTDNKSGWKCRYDRLNHNNPEMCNKIITYSEVNGLSELPFKLKVWHFINNAPSIPKCKTCNGNVNFKGNLTQGYCDYCSLTCSANNNTTKLKVKNTSLSKYGVEHPSQSNIVRNKYIKTCENKYGTDNVSKVKEINTKREDTIMDRFGVNSILKLGSTRKALLDYSLKTFNVSHPSQADEIKESKMKTLIDNYGVSNPMLSSEIRNRQTKTLIDNYGVSNPMLSPEIKKVCLTNMVNTKFRKFISKYPSLTGNVISWSGLSLHMSCDDCKSEYDISRELLTLRYSSNRLICTICNPLYQSQHSQGEQELVDYIDSLGIEYETGNRTILDGKEVDIYIPSHKLAIEFNGLYWHSELFVDKEYHLEKTKVCEANGIQLIHIFEDEWLYKQDIVKSRLKNMLGLTYDKIFARKCVIKEVATSDAKAFCYTNHIQDYSASKYKIGLYYANELVSLMLFSKTRIAMGGTGNNIELVRFCNKLNTNVVGGAGKLLKYFTRKYNPREIISYADRRWSQGGLYETIGFDLSHDSAPNYWYVKNSLRKHRFNYRKSNLVKLGFDTTKTEKEIMLENGYYRIYDCGHKKYYLECVQ
jgi:hypothetical protein